MIAILDYGAGNLRSVANTLDEIGAAYEVRTTAEALDTFDKVILPGVGHFGQMTRAMDKLGFRTAIENYIATGKPFLGICVGLQCLFESSEEAPEDKGLALFPGVVARFPNTARVPQMGWNSLTYVKDSALLQGLGADPYVYFANSYYAPLNDATAALCFYEVPFTAVLQRGNVHAVQFHPEKSGPVGLQVMRNFVELC
ncbi:imidazole glycerol phosphate synthase subunit HisH [Bryobacterales bacterium F-183]|nr:imidazole glycerol phosphate synthase subunit HisH [Bryobacterales bacterium F-183]